LRADRTKGARRQPFGCSGPAARTLADEGVRAPALIALASTLQSEFAMKFFRNALVFSALFAAGAVSEATSATPNVVLWDTSSPLGNTLNPQDRTGWKAVPRDLTTLEAEPPKASSDPGYYGREYWFRGDAVVENREVAAVFWSAQGRVVLCSKRNPADAHGNLRDSNTLGTQIAEILPLDPKAPKPVIGRVEVVRNGEDQVVLKACFSTEGSADLWCSFGFGKGEIVEIKPSEGMKGVSLRSSVRYAVAPSFIGDDLIFGANDYASYKTLCVAAENMLVALLDGEETELVLSWPQGKQSMRLQLAEQKPGILLIDGVDFENDGQALYVAALSAPGIWHSEPLEPSFLEKDVPIKWKKPFPARWKTQLYEEGVKTTFSFRNSKGQIWRGVPGSYDYPVWFDADEAFFRLSKKVVPKGEALIYFLEGQDTPASISTPVDILQGTLGREASEPILDVAGRKLRTHHRRGGDGVRRACTCGCTEAIQAVFEAGQEVPRKPYIQGALDDMIYFVHRHVERINQYRAFADELNRFLEAKGRETSELKGFIDSLQQIVGQIPQEYEVQKENMKSFQYADDLARQTLTLASRTDTNNVKAYMELLKAWRAMGGAQDYVLARCHMITRLVCQEAGYGCVHQPEAVALAREVRRRCKQALRTPDGYEIWADY